MLLSPNREMPGGVRHRERITELAAERLSEIFLRVETDGNSRNRVKVCWHLSAPCFAWRRRVVPRKMEILNFNTFVSLSYQQIALGRKCFFVAQKLKLFNSAC